MFYLYINSLLCGSWPSAGKNLSVVVKMSVKESESDNSEVILAKRRHKVAIFSSLKKRKKVLKIGEETSQKWKFLLLLLNIDE